MAYQERDGSRAGSQQPSAAAGAQLAALAQVTGSFADTRIANERLQFANLHFHLVSPATSCGTLQVGCELSLAAVNIDIEEETYDVGQGKRALHKAPLEKISFAMGLGWIPQLCRRLDDGSDPYYAHFEVAGVVKSFDGSPLPVTGHKELDLREGSMRVTEIKRRAEIYNANPRNHYKRDPMDQIRMERQHILSHAETKAKLRAIRSMGVRAAYKPEALAKPFVCARVIFTGRSDNPELAKLFALAIAQSHLSSSTIAYGSQFPQLPSSNNDNDKPALTAAMPPMTATAEVVRPHAPPPVGQRVVQNEREEDLGELDDDDDDGEDDREPRDVRDDRDRDDENPPTRSRSQFVIPAGKERGVLLKDASSAELQFWSNRLRDDLDAGHSRTPDEDEELFEAMLDQIKSRTSKRTSK
jgi:hypothetical protein